LCKQPRTLSYIDKSGLPNNWANEAACKGVNAELFHPGRGENRTVALAIAICKNCVVVDDCLHYALSNSIKVGIWGGKSERQRRAIRKEIREQ
jgi:WhiB family redox-sensing transcriptional regulator